MPPTSNRSPRNEPLDLNHPSLLLLPRRGGPSVAPNVSRTRATTTKSSTPLRHRATLPDNLPRSCSEITFTLPTPLLPRIHLTTIRKAARDGLQVRVKLSSTWTSAS